MSPAPCWVWQECKTCGTHPLGPLPDRPPLATSQMGSLSGAVLGGLERHPLSL